MTPWIAAAVITSLVAAAMADWSPTEWGVFIGVITTSVVTIIGAIVTGVLKVAALIRRQNQKLDLQNQKLEQVTKATNGNLERAIRTVAEEVREAEKSNVLENTAFPTSPEELHRFAEQAALLALKKYQAEQAPKVQT